MANHTAFMKLWVGDYISDTGTLNTQRHGAYFLLILEYWKSGCIPKVDEELFLVCKAMTSTAQSDVLFVRDKYFIDGVHKRLDKELLIAKKAYDKRVSAQSKSVESRKANSNAIAKQLAKPLQSSDSDSSSSSSSTSNTKWPFGLMML
ncbi:MAG: DUF1376 domain-containing protein, partial [Candidatus Sabulitectum sp.]|nr:DUF1376 domain-containing protein [Candidatus Sabulitectum sp.]